MAKDPAPAPAEAKSWEPPEGDQEFEFKSIADAPEWIDKSWATFDRGPALAVPMGNLDGSGPWHTATARVGDKVVYTAPKGASPGKFSIVESEPDPEDAGAVTRKPPQVSAASLEDMLRTGVLSPDDLGEDAKAQVAVRTPGLKKMIEEGKGAPKAQKIDSLVKVK